MLLKGDSVAGMSIMNAKSNFNTEPFEFVKGLSHVGIIPFSIGFQLIVGFNIRNHDFENTATSNYSVRSVTGVIPRPRRLAQTSKVMVLGVQLYEEIKKLTAHVLRSFACLWEVCWSTIGGRRAST